MVIEHEGWEPFTGKRLTCGSTPRKEVTFDHRVQTDNKLSRVQARIKEDLCESHECNIHS